MIRFQALVRKVVQSMVFLCGGVPQSYVPIPLMFEKLPQPATVSFLTELTMNKYEKRQSGTSHNITRNMLFII